MKGVSTFRTWVVLGACATLGGCAERGSGQLEVLERTVVGRELRLIVSTSRHYRPPLSHSSRTSDVKGWLVAVDLESARPITERTRVFGPLWDSPAERSFVSFKSGANFTNADARAAADTPVCVFDTDGALLRFSWDGSRRVRDELVERSDGGSWTRRGDVRPIDERTQPMSEDRTESRSGRHVLLFQDGSARLFDQFTGERKEDDWLTASFAHARSIPKLENVRFFLTEDLNHLVLNPVAVWNDGGDGVRTFDLDAQSYSRAETVLVYSRPDARPSIVGRPADSSDEPPSDVFVIDGRLRFFDSASAWLRLYDPDGRGEIRAESNDAAAWPLGRVNHAQHVSAANEIVLWDRAELMSEQHLDFQRRTERVVIWNYRTGTIARYSAQIADLFEADGARLRPKTSFPVAGTR